VKLLDGALRHRAVVVIDERKPARPPRFAVSGDHDLQGVTDSAEVLADIDFGGAIGEIPDE
jgi:hypothetical protein